ncbi:MAG: hypothetical protein AAFX93_10895 [Verrucomicrobiota bacterium]
MSYTIEVDDTLEIVRIISLGDLNTDEIFDMIDQLNGTCFRSGVKNVLADHSRASVGDIPIMGVRSIASYCETLNDSMDGGRLSVLLSKPLDYGIGRIWLAYVHGRLTYEAQIFRKLQKGLAYLAAKKCAAH